MTKEESTKLVDFIYDSFPDAAKPTPGIYRIWYMALGGKTYDEAYQAAAKVCGESDRVPRPKAVAELLSKRGYSSFFTISPRQFKDIVAAEEAKGKVCVFTDLPNGTLVSYSFVTKDRARYSGDTIRIHGVTLPKYTHLP